MKDTLKTLILLIILIIVLLGTIIIGKAIYIDLFSNEANQTVYKIDNIATEEPTESQKKSKDSIYQTINNSIQSILSDPEENTPTYKYTNENPAIDMFFYKQLNENQKIFYNGLEENKDNLKKGNYVIDFNETFSETLSKDGGSDKLGDDYQTAVEAFVHDNPDLFYLDVNKMYLNIKTTAKFLRTRYNVYISAEEGSTYLSNEFSNLDQIEQSISAVEKVKEEILNKLPSEDYKKILYIHDYLLDNIEYDSSYQAIGTYSIYGALIGKKCVCEGYAKAFKYLTNAAGIECEIMQGVGTNSSGESESHAWNCIKFNDSWYEVDVTWDDPVVIGIDGRISTLKTSKDIRYKYFLKGSATFSKDHKLSYQFSDGGKTFSYPTLSQKDY